MDDRLADNIRGVIYGQAIGDALGLGLEGMSRDDVRRNYPKGLNEYYQIVQDKHRKRWIPGQWTDDTEQMICILKSLLERRIVDVEDIARRLAEWRSSDGLGIDMVSYSVLTHPDFAADPHKASRAVWEAGGRESAGNGGVMRTSVLGAWEFWDAERVRQNASSVCRITHFDPRCVASCVAVCHAISALLRGEQDPVKLMVAVSKMAIDLDERAHETAKLAARGSLMALHLDDRVTMGHTLKTLGAGLWAMVHATDFEHGLSRVIHAGGDADCNGAVAGALLGARFGFQAIPRLWREDLIGAERLDPLIDGLIQILDESRPPEASGEGPETTDTGPQAAE